MILLKTNIIIEKDSDNIKSISRKDNIIKILI